MIHLENAELRVDLLDPVADAARQGTRYCWGGYIWQVHDRRLGPLLAGPEWPHPAPSAFNGQGLPESFRHRTRDGKPLTWRGAEGIGIGIGALASDPAGAVTLVEPCAWTVAAVPGALTFVTRHAAAGFSYRLVRRIALEGRTVTSTTEFTAERPGPIDFQWFAHPFFALSQGRIEAQLPAGCTLRDNPGFEMSGDTLRCRRAFEAGDPGEFALLATPAGKNFRTTLTHPRLARVAFAGDFAPDECPVWANAHTFSIEPYRHLCSRNDETLRWALTYSFPG